MTRKLKGIWVDEITYKLPEELREEFEKLYLSIFDHISEVEAELLRLVEEEDHEQVKEQIGLVVYTIMRFRGWNPADYTITNIYGEVEDTDDQEA